MTNKEIKDLSRYFKLIAYRDAYEDINTDELNELEQIIKRNKKEKDLEEAKVQLKNNVISIKDFLRIYDAYYIEVSVALSEMEFSNKRLIKQ